MKLMKRIWFRIGNHYRKKRDFEQALKYMRKGESAITSFNDKLHYAELLHNSGYSDEAVAYLGRVIETSGSHRAYERRAHILRELNREREAIEDLDEAIRLNADNYMNWYTRGIAHKDLNQYEEAIRDLKESIKREDDSTVISTYYELGMAYYESGNPAEAAHYFRLSIQKPERAIPMYYYMLSVSLDLMDHVQEAVGVLQEESSWLTGMKRRRMADTRCSREARTTAMARSRRFSGKRARRIPSGSPWRICTCSWGFGAGRALSVGGH